MRERGEARRQRLWKWGPESRLLCALPVRRSVPAKVVTTILRGSYFGERTVAGLETGTRWGRGNLQSIPVLTVETSGGGWEGRIPSQSTLWWRNLVVRFCTRNQTWDQKKTKL